jgi:hypothetical protein
MDVSGVSEVKRHAKIEAMVKMNVIAFLNHQGVQQKYAPDGQTVNKKYYIKAIHQLHKQPALWKRGD